MFISHFNFSLKTFQDFDKKSLLEEFLREILLAENSLQLQRLYSEYKEQLEGNLIDTI